MSAARPLLKLRKEINGSGKTTSAETDADHLSLATESNISEHMNTTMENSMNSYTSAMPYNNAKILTENDKYVVKKLTPELPMLKDREDDDIFEGHIDTHCGKALVNDADFLYIWDYQSCQREADFCKIPLHEEYAVLNTPPKCLFTWPPAMDDSTQMFLEGSATSSGGACIIHRKNGQFIYFEDIDTVNNLHSQLSKSKANILNLKLKENEMIEMAINCEPAGIVISTTFGRLLFVTLRDSTGKLNVRLKQQLIKSQMGFFFHSFNNLKELVSLKLGPIVGRGERLIHVVTRGGDFQTWHLSLGVSCYKRIEVNVYEQILDSIQGLYPFAHGTLQILDAHPLFPDLSSAHLVLSSITNNNEMFYILSTIILDERTNSFTIFSTYRLNTYVMPFGSHKPKLFIPDALNEKNKATTTVFVLFANAIVLTQVSSNLDSSFPLRRKWEDIISLREDVKIIGSGYNADSLYIMTNKLGVFEVTINNNETENQNELRFVKSHIDQAVYFSDVSASPLEFNLPKDIALESDEVEYDLSLSVDEIFFSNSKYIPPMLDTLTHHLSLRVDLFQNLIHFITANFNLKISHYAKLEILEKFQILNCALRFSTCLKESKQISELWNRIPAGLSGSMTLDSVMVDQLDKFPEYFTKFLSDATKKDSLSKSIEFKSEILSLVNSCLYKAILEEGEKNIRFEAFKLDRMEINKSLPWFITSDILTAINTLFFDYEFSATTISTEKIEELLSLVKVLYYCFNQANIWFNQEHLHENSNTYDKLKSLFEENHLSWNLALCELSLQETCLQITEFYRDYEALVAILETLDRDLAQDLYLQYFDQFGYDFASVVFTYYIKHNRRKDLFYRFPSQHDLLVDFFKSSENYADLAWIEEIFDEDYAKAANTLKELSVGKNVKTQSLQENRLYLSISKLSFLVGESTESQNELINTIQTELDLTDAQQDLNTRLDQGTNNMSSRYEGSEMEKVYNSLIAKLKEGNTLPAERIIQVYTLFDDANSFYNSLKLLAFAENTLEFEKSTLLAAQIWRRCILSQGDWSHIHDITTTALYQVLYKFFDEKLYFSNCPLPSYDLISNENFLNSESISQSYGGLANNLDAIKVDLINELEAIKNLGKQFETRIQSTIGSANKATGNQCTINYESNSIEL